jgi:hypothetical protein
MSPIARLPARDLSNTDLLDGGGEGVYIETKQKTGTRKRAELLFCDSICQFGALEASQEDTESATLWARDS